MKKFTIDICWSQTSAQYAELWVWQRCDSFTQLRGWIGRLSWFITYTH